MCDGKENRYEFMNPKSSYERILMAPTCRLINLLSSLSSNYSSVVLRFAERVLEGKVLEAVNRFLFLVLQNCHDKMCDGKENRLVLSPVLSSVLIL